MSIKPVRTLIASSVLMFAASASQAAVVEDWAYSVNLKWDTSSVQWKAGTTAGTKQDSLIVSSDVISWGSKNTGAHYFHSDVTKARSGVVITQPNGSGSFSTGGPSSVVNMFTHHNSELWGEFTTFKSADLVATIDLKLPGSSQTVQKVSTTFQVHFLETPNIAGTNCAWGTCSSDIFAVVAAPKFGSAFTYGGVDYEVNYFESSQLFNPLSETACAAVGITGACYGFTTREGVSSTASFSFSVTAVPEPEAYAMLLAGLGIVGVVARRRRNMVRG